MTDRVNALFVILEKDMRDDDVECLVEAIKCFRFVLSVKNNVSTPENWIAEDRAKAEFRAKLWELMK